MNRIAFLSTYILLFLLYIIYYLGQDSQFWANYGHIFPTQVCEYRHIGYVFRQPFAVFSSLAYWYFGIAIFADVWQNKGNTRLNKMEEYCFMGLGLGLLSLFVGSTFYHAAILPIGYQMDLAGCFVIALILNWYGLFSILHHKKRIQWDQWTLLHWSVLALVTLILVYYSVQWTWTQDHFGLLVAYHFGIVLSWTYLHYYIKKGHLLLFIMAAVVGYLGFSFFKLDHFYCNQTSWFQGHFWWHVLSALCFYLLYQSRKRVAVY